MGPAFFDNRASILKDDLVKNIQVGDRVSIAASVFSMYAYQELKDQLANVDEFRFLFTSQTFTRERAPREKREFYIPRLNREQGLYGTKFDIRLRNELTQKAIAAECAEWIRAKATFKSFTGDAAMGNTFLALEGKDDGEDVAYMPFNGFTTSELGTEKASTSYTCITRMPAVAAATYLDMFNRAWNDSSLQDVTDAVIDGITAMYQENAPELIYYAAL